MEDLEIDDLFAFEGSTSSRMRCRDHIPVVCRREERDDHLHLQLCELQSTRIASVNGNVAVICTHPSTRARMPSRSPTDETEGRLQVVSPEKASRVEVGGIGIDLGVEMGIEGIIDLSRLSRCGRRRDGQKGTYHRCGLSQGVFAHPQVVRSKMITRENRR